LLFALREAETVKATLYWLVDTSHRERVRKGTRMFSGQQEFLLKIFENRSTTNPSVAPFSRYPGPGSSCALPEGKCERGKEDSGFPEMKNWIGGEAAVGSEKKCNVDPFGDGFGIGHQLRQRLTFEFPER